MKHEFVGIPDIQRSIYFCYATGGFAWGQQYMVSTQDIFTGKSLVF